MAHNRLSLTQTQINEVPQSTWYKYTMECGHEIYSKVRIAVPKDYSFMENFIRCPQCDMDASIPTAWQPIKRMEAKSDEFMRNVSSWTAFILPNRIMRTLNGSPAGNPFPYVSSVRDY